ncbi:UNVERIFIED_CONTAM: peptide/nickel transport system substrate-binding protein [Williamsia faeni]
MPAQQKSWLDPSWHVACWTDLPDVLRLGRAGPQFGQYKLAVEEVSGGMLLYLLAQSERFEMIRCRYSPRTLVLAIGSIAMLVFLVACGGASSPIGGSSEDVGDPVLGGTVRVLQTSEPRSLDPASLSNTYAHQPTLGNALYGTLMIDDINTFDIIYKMATDFSSTDGGTTFTLSLQPGLTFTDGTPLDAAAVKFNWDRLKNRDLGSTSIRQATQIATSEVVDPTNLRVTLVGPNPHFAQALVASALNWIASPTALNKGPAAFDEDPVGAGPFTLDKWTRQDSIELTKNAGYWDAPKPYLDHLTIKTVADSSQRINAIVTKAADIASERNMANVVKAEGAGFQSEIVPTGGGTFMGMNQRRAPFNDVRARRAVQLAVNTDDLNTIVYNGENMVPQSLFAEGSPFYTDIKLQERNEEEAQRLFNELAAEGKPVSFTFVTYPTTENKTLAEGLQAQLAAYDNVEVKIEALDAAGATARAGQRDFDMITTGAIIQDPDFPLWMAFHSQSTGNFVGMNDSELDTALDTGRIAKSDQERKSAYDVVQERLVEDVPGIWYSRAVPSVIYGPDIHGVELYTLGSPLPEEIWRG